MTKTECSGDKLVCSTNIDGKSSHDEDAKSLERDWIASINRNKIGRWSIIWGKEQFKTLMEWMQEENIV